MNKFETRHDISERLVLIKFKSFSSKVNFTFAKLKFTPKPSCRETEIFYFIEEGQDTKFQPYAAAGRVNIKVYFGKLSECLNELNTLYFPNAVRWLHVNSFPLSVH